MNFMLDCLLQEETVDFRLRGQKGNYDLFLWCLVGLNPQNFMPENF